MVLVCLSCLLVLVFGFEAVCQEDDSTARRGDVLALIVGERGGRALAASYARAQLAHEPVLDATEAAIVRLAHDEVDEGIYCRARVRHHVRDPVDVRPPAGKLGRVLAVEQHGLQWRPAHEKHHQDPNQHHN